MTATTTNLKAAENWNQYWAQDAVWSDSKIWERNAQIFMRRFHALFPLRPEETVLSIGCGAGHLEELLAPKVRRLTAADASLRLLDACRERCSKLNNVEYRLMTTPQKSFSEFGCFSLFIAASVIQYLEGTLELTDWVLMAKKASLPGARMLITDIPLRRPRFKKAAVALASMGRAIRGGYFLDLAACACTLLNPKNPYRRMESRNPARLFSLEELEPLQSLTARFEIIPESFSVHSGRISLWLEFS